MGPNSYAALLVILLHFLVVCYQNVDHAFGWVHHALRVIVPLWRHHLVLNGVSAHGIFSSGPIIGTSREIYKMSGNQNFVKKNWAVPRNFISPNSGNQFFCWKFFKWQKTLNKYATLKLLTYFFLLVVLGYVLGRDNPMEQSPILMKFCRLVKHNSNNFWSYSTRFYYFEVELS